MTVLPSPYDRVAARLAERLPEARIVTDPLRLMTWGTDASLYRLIPKIVTVIESEAEVGFLLDVCRESGVPLTFRAAGTSLELIAVENGSAQLKMPSGELRLVHPSCRATIGVLGNGDHNKQSLGKAGRKRWLGVRPTVRGVAMNPVDHPNGGGQGKSKGGGGRQHLVSPWGQLAKGYVTRRRSKLSNSMIIVHHNGRKPRGKK